MKLVTVAEMQEAEKGAGVPVGQLMENAGLAVAQEAWLLLGEVAERRIVVLAGPGNNGGDGLVAARHLREWGARVSVYLLKRRDKKDAVFAPLLKAEVPATTAEEDAKQGYKRLEELLVEADLVIDALLGTGSARPIEGALAEVLERLRAARGRTLPPRLLAVDMPTGVDADTGAADPRCVAADATVALAWSKVGLHVLPGAQLAGRVEVVEIGIPKETESEQWTELMTARWARSALPERPPGAHKGTFGRVLVVAGSPRYIGAAVLSCMGGLRAGAGLVTLACASTLYPIFAAKLTEATFEPLPDEEGYLTAEGAHAVGQALGGGYDSLLVGPGLGQEGYVHAFMRSLLPRLKADTPSTGSGQGLRGVVIDADGLNNLSEVEGWWKDISAPTVVTPHPGELSRLTGLPMEEIQSDRLAVARKCAAEWGVTVVLKGANTVVAAPDPDGHGVRARLSPFANPGLASAGTGDVLAGAIAGLLAQGPSTRSASSGQAGSGQGLEPYEAASLGVYLHGLAGERVRAELGSAGMVASDLLPALPRAMKELRGE
ncbi:MAG: NAD(P)H-hydrate dehydratase [Chloroflexi bacterium]|nr:NAD(P)H-hydrate dehydratase [Chloroflexota bacterium]